MTKNPNWMQRAFPTLSVDEAEKYASALNEPERSQLEWIVTSSDLLSELPNRLMPSVFQNTDIDEFSRQYVFGTEPIPDLECAEYIRRDLQFLLAQWSKEFINILSISVANAIAEKSGKTNPHKMRWLLWRLSDGDIHRRGVVKELAEKLSSDARLCNEFGFPTGSKEKKHRMNVVKNLIKDMRKVSQKGSRPFNLSQPEIKELENFADFEDISAIEIFEPKIQA